MSSHSDILKITEQLYPTGRAFRMYPDSYRYGLHSALGISEAKAYDDAASILDSLIPDNDKFTVDDASDWERRLEINASSSTSLSDRKKAILRKMAAPGINPAKGHYLYLESQLQAAGFPVYVHENLFPIYPNTFENQAPNLHYGTSNLIDLLHGNQQHGGIESPYWNNLVVNSIDQNQDNSFDTGGLQCTFFIGGASLGSYANVPLSRKTEFRQLILALKQVQAVGLLFINFI